MIFKDKWDLQPSADRCTSYQRQDDEAADAQRCAEDPHDAVLKVFVAESEYNYGVPWSTHPQTSICGSAFACRWHGRQVLLTSAHLVRDAALVELRKRGDHAKHVATVLCLGVECDLALL